MNVLKRGVKIKLWGVKFRKSTEDWLLYKKHKIKESTYLKYKYIIDTYLCGEFGKKRLNFFMNYDINIFIDKLQKRLSNKTVRDIILILKSILKLAERKYNVNFNLDLITVPIAHKPELQIFNENEVKKIEKNVLIQRISKQ